MKPERLTVAQLVCRHMPPLIGQRLRAWLYPQTSAFADDYEFVTTAQTGSKFTNRTSDFHGYPFSVYGYNNWRAWAVALAVCSPGDTIIEVGANIGTETIEFADIVGCKGSVHAFEPLPANVSALTKTLQLHQCQNVHVHDFALGESNRSVQFLVSPSNNMSGIGRIISGDVTQGRQTIDVECRTLDSMKDVVGNSELIFMDAEGAEYSILRGGTEYFQDFHPAIVVEAGKKQLGHHGLTLDDLFSQLEAMNYRVYEITRLGLRLIRPPDFNAKTSDWFCVHNSEQQVKVGRVALSLKRCGLIPCIPGLNPMTSVRHSN